MHREIQEKGRPPPREGRAGTGQNRTDSPIDHHDHPLLAVARLRTVQIHGIRVQHGHVKCPDHPTGAAVERDEPAMQTGDCHPRSRRVLEGLAWRRLGRLRHRVVARGELELDHVAGPGGHAVGREAEGAAANQHGDEARGAGEGIGGDYFGAADQAGVSWPFFSSFFFFLFFSFSRVQLLFRAAMVS